MVDGDAAATRAGRWRRAGLGIALILGLVGAGVAGIVVGRSTAPGPSLVVLPGPVVEQMPAADPLSTSGLVGADRLVVGGMSVNAPVVFTASADLDDTPTTASGYRLTRSGLDGAAVAQGLASVFGVTGSVVRTVDGWTVGAESDPSLTVRDDAALSWMFIDPAATKVAEGGAFVTPRLAKDAAAALLAGIGLDMDSVDWQVGRYDDHLAVTAMQMIDGNRTSLQWQVNFGQNNSVVSASGLAAEVVEVPGYAVVGAATAVRRAGLPTWSLIGPTPVIDATDLAARDLDLQPPSDPLERSDLQIDVSSVVVTDAVLGLAQFRQPSGALLVLPAYRLTGDDGSVWTLIAVAGDYIDFVDQPYPGLPHAAS